MLIARAHLHVVDDLLEQTAETAVRYFLDADIHGDLFSLIYFSDFMNKNLFFFLFWDGVFMSHSHPH